MEKKSQFWSYAVMNTALNRNPVWSGFLLLFLFSNSLLADTVLITGSNSGIGLDFARRYAEQGYDVIATHRRDSIPNTLKDLSSNHKNVRIERVDISNLEDIDALARKLRNIPVDILINNASITDAGAFSSPENFSKQVVGNLDYGLFDQYMATNARGTIKMSEAFLPHIRAGKQKKIVVISSDAAQMSVPDERPGLYWYHASKVAANMVMKKFARDLKHEGIIVVVFHPGFVRTDKSVPKQKISKMAYMIDLEESVPGMMDVISYITLEDTGSFLKWTGEHQAW